MQSLKDSRKEKGHTVRSLAALVGVSRQAISAYENNKYLPSNAVWLKIVETLELQNSDIAEYFDTENKKYNRYSDDSVCQEPGCCNRPAAKNFCKKHYYKNLRGKSKNP